MPTANDNTSRTAAQKADLVHWREGDVVMLRAEARTHEGDPHPDAGRIGSISRIGADRSPWAKMMVQTESDDAAGKDIHLLLPVGLFLAVPTFCVERFSPRSGCAAWRLSAEGRRVLSGMGWPLTAASFGEE